MASVLLRTLLALCLVLNGIGNAVAGVAMHRSTAAGAQQRATQHETGMSMPNQMDPDCDAMAAQAADPASQAPGGHDPDCCKHGTCVCACMHHAPVLPVLLMVLPRAGQRLPPASLPIAVRAAPPMLERLRPPIG